MATTAAKPRAARRARKATTERNTRARATVAAAKGVVREHAEELYEEASGTAFSEENVARLAGAWGTRDSRKVVMGAGQENPGVGPGRLSLDDLETFLAMWHSRGRQAGYGDGYQEAAREFEFREPHIRREVLMGALLMVKTELGIILRVAARPGLRAANHKAAIDALVQFAGEIGRTYDRLEQGEVPGS